MIDNYLKFIRDTSGIAKTKYYLSVYSEPVYEPLNKEFLYLISTPEKIKAHTKRKTDYGIYYKNWISSLFIPDITKPNFAYADIKNTEDLILIYIADNLLEMFVCKGKKNLFQLAINLFLDGGLNEEIENLKKRAIFKNEQKLMELLK